jgi:hypothetical protein
MEKTQKQVLKAIADRLDEVSNVSLYPGNFDQWTNWARKMKDTIQSVTPILNTISSSIDENEQSLQTFKIK